MMHGSPLLTCAEFEALVPDLLDGTLGSLTEADRERMAAHRKACDACNALATDLARIKHDAAHLSTLTPSRDLWDGISSRIETEVVQFPVTPVPGQVGAVRPAGNTRLTPHDSQLATPTPRLSSLVSRLSLAAAASILVAATAGVTWFAASSRMPGEAAQAADSGFAAAMDGTRNLRVVSRPAMNEAYDREIAELRRIVDERRTELDAATVAVLERNLQLIDQAIAESKAALAASPSSAFLLDRLSDAYATKLRTLRAVATMPIGG